MNVHEQLKKAVPNLRGYVNEPACSYDDVKDGTRKANRAFCAESSKLGHDTPELKWL